MISLTYASELVEESVLLAERTMSVEARRAFRRQRNRLYEQADPDEREARFRNLHTQWFVHLGLHLSIEQAVGKRLAFVDRVGAGRVVAAVTAREEGADLVDRVVPGTGDEQPLLVIRVRPLTLLDAAAVHSLLHHELTHVADMLDPAFGYERELPATGDGPSADTIQRDRYRVLWDVTIDGRLARIGAGAVGSRSIRWQEFDATFPMLGPRARASFDRWFDRAQPTHAALAAFARAPGAINEADDEATRAIRQ